jgi:heat shock protein HslJ
MRRLGAALCIALATTGPAAAQSLICFGSEPSWSVTFTAPDQARVSTPDGPASTYVGKEARIEPLGERLWRGSSEAGGDLVVFLRDTACSDGMSDTTHPITARVSMPDGAFLAGCCRIPAPEPEPAAFERAPWRLVSGPGLAPATLAGLERGVTAKFEGGRVAGFSGCNTFTGGYAHEANRLRIGQLAGTMMACPEPAMTVERAFHGALNGTSFAYAISGDRLTLTADSGTQLTFLKQPAETPEGGNWEVTGFNNGRQAVVGPMTGTRITVAFRQGTVAGEAGCNTFHAPYSLAGSRIAVGPAAATRKMCEPAVMTQEREFLTALASASTWSIDSAGLLHLHRPDGERVLVAGPRRQELP